MRLSLPLTSLLTPVTLLGLAGYLFIGTAAVLIPSVMPFLTEEYLATGLTLGMIGYIFWARAGGGVVGNLLAGIGSDRIGYHRLVWIAALAVAATLALTAAARPWLLFLGGFALISIAQASLATGINAMIADANPDSRARALNVLHGVYAVGATISPLVFGFVLQWGVRWRWTVAATGLIWLVYGGISSFFYRSNGPSVGEDARGQGLDWGMLRNAGFLSLFLIAFIYNGVAYSLLAWVALFMQESAGLGTLASISSVSVFYVALTAGRFICAAFAERIGYARTLLVLAVVLIVIYPLMLLSTDPDRADDRRLLHRAESFGALSDRAGLRVAPLPRQERRGDGPAERRDDGGRDAAALVDGRARRDLEFPDRAGDQLLDGVDFDRGLRRSGAAGTTSNEE